MFLKTNRAMSETMIGLIVVIFLILLGLVILGSKFLSFKDSFGG